MCMFTSLDHFKCHHFQMMEGCSLGGSTGAELDFDRDSDSCWNTFQTKFCGYHAKTTKQIRNLLSVVIQFPSGLLWR